MSAPHRDMRVRLQRDALTTPWGFRLQGGKDFKAPLAVQRVFVGSPADGELHRGDVITSIENSDTSGLIHKQAQDLIKGAGGQLMLGVRRGVPRGTAPLSPITPTQPKQQTSILPPQQNPNALPNGGGQQNQASYRSRPLDNYAPKPAPKLPQVNRPKLMDSYAPHAPFQPAYQPPHKPQQVLSRALAPFAPIPSSTPKKKTFVPRPAEPMYGQTNFGADYSRRYGGQPTARAAPPQGGMLNKVQTTLNQAIWAPGQGEFDQQGDPDYTPRPVGEIKQMFGGARQRGPPAAQQPKAWKKPAPTNLPSAGLSDPGWSPGMPSAVQQQQKPGWSPVRAPAGGHPMSQYSAPAPAPAQVPVNRAQSSQVPQNLGYNQRPAWAGTLKSAGGAKPWEVHAAAEAAGTAPAPQAQQAQGHAPAVQPHQPRVQNVHYGPGDSAPRYEQHDPSAGDHKDAVAVHAQYNSPLALYSKQNVQDALDGQTTGKPGEGTIQVVGTGGGQGSAPVDFRQSDVARMIAEEEGRGQKPRGYGLQQQQQQPAEQSARYVEQAPGEEMNYQGYQDHSRQSQSFRALEANMAQQGGDVGASDF